MTLTVHRDPTPIERITLACHDTPADTITVDDGFRSPRIRTPDNSSLVIVKDWETLERFGEAVAEFARQQRDADAA